MQHACGVGVGYELWRGNQANHNAQNRDYVGRAVVNRLSVCTEMADQGELM